MGLRAIIMGVVAATIPCAALLHADQPARGAMDASFVQIGRAQLSFDEARWRTELSVLGELGVHLVIVQFTGDEHGAYDRGNHAPVAALLDAAHQMGMTVYLGLYHDPTWPSDAAVARSAPPFDNSRDGGALGELCTRSPACAGWYVSQEIEDATWSNEDSANALREHLARTSRTLRELAPGKSIAIAPYFSGALGPRDYASWLADVLAPGAVDIVILQDGVGTGRATPELAGSYIAELRPTLARAGVELWSVAELFRQIHGQPVDHEPFEAVPADPARLRRSLEIEAPLVQRIVAFSVLDYMDPRRGGEARRLYDEARHIHDDDKARCRAAPSLGRTPC